MPVFQMLIRRTCPGTALLLIPLFLLLAGPVPAGDHRAGPDRNDPSMYDLDLRSSLSLSYVPKMEPYTMRQKDLNTWAVTEAVVEGGRVIFSPGVRLVFNPRFDGGAESCFFLEIPVSMYSSHVSSDKKGSALGRIQTGVSEVALGYKFGFSVPLSPVFSLTLGYRYEKLDLSLNHDETIYSRSQYLGRASGTVTVAGNRSTVLPGIEYRASSNLLLQCQVVYMSASIQPGEVYLLYPDGEDTYESSATLISTTGTHVEFGATLVW
jgi:hypothetical protein